MKKLAGIRVIGVVAGTAFAMAVLAVEASAQTLQSTDRAFGGLNFGGQTKARSYESRGSLPLYEETATFESAVGIGAGGLFDLSAGWRVWNNVAVGLGFSKYSDTSTGILNASIPDPLLFDTPRAGSISVDGLEHSQSQIHLSVYWLQPVTDKIDVSAYAGPTLFKVKQDILSGFTVTPGTNTLAAATQTTIDEGATGLHFGVDARYLLMKNAGVGLFIRYTSGRVDSPLVDGGRLEVGGFQYGVGVRVRY